MTERGVIKNILRKQQINDFSGLRYGNITPTDIDGVIEYKDRAYVFFEVKYRDAPLPFGQKLCLERLINDLSKVKPNVLFVVEHYVDDVNESVGCAGCNVRAMYYKGQWNHYNHRATLKQFIDYFFKHIEQRQSVNV